METVKDLKQQLVESRENGDERAIANAAYKLGDLYLQRGKSDQALPLLRESYVLCEEHENTEGKARVALCLAALFLREKDPEQASPCAREAFEHFLEAQDPKALVEACRLQGDTLWSRDDPSGALPFFRQALEICRKHGDNLGTAVFLDRTATQYRLLGQEEDARTHFQASYRLWETLGIPDRQAVTLTNLANIHAGLGAPREAVRLYELALPLFRQLCKTKAVEALEKEISRLKQKGPEPHGPPS